MTKCDHTKAPPALHKLFGMKHIERSVAPLMRCSGLMPYGPSAACCKHMREYASKVRPEFAGLSGVSYIRCLPYGLREPCFAAVVLMLQARQ